jgi:hypothetical protein
VEHSAVLPSAFNAETTALNAPAMRQRT